MKKINQIDFKKIFPIVYLKGGISVNNSADITVFFKLKLQEIFSISDLQYENQRRIIENAISSLPDNIIFQKLDFFNEATYIPKTSESFVLRANEKHFAERSFIFHSSYIMISFLSNERKKTPLDLNVFKTLRKLENVDILAQEADKFADVFKDIIKGSDSISVERMNDQEIVELFYRYCNLDFKGDCNSQANEISIEPNYIVIGNKILMGMRINEFNNTLYSSLPFRTESVEISMTHPLCLGFPKNHIVSQVIRKDGTKKQLNAMEKRAKTINMLPTAENLAIQDNLNNFIDNAVNSKSDVVSVEYNIFFYDLTARDTEQTRNSLVSQCSRLNFKPLIHSRTTFSAWLSNLPGNTSDIYEYKTMLLPEAVTLLNLETNYKSGVGGIKLCDKLSGVPVEVDLRAKELDHKNFVAVGPPGAGKSFLENFLAHQLFYLREHIIVIEIGRSFKNHCLALKNKGSQHFEYSLDKPISFNPFTISEFDLSLDAKDNDSVIFLTAFMFCLWGDEEKTRVSDSVMSDMLYKYFSKKRKEQKIPNFKDFYLFIDEYFKESPGEEDFFNYKSFKRVLKKYYDGQYSHIFGDSNIDLKSCPFIVFELIEIKNNSDLLPIVVLIMIETIMEKFRKLKGIRKTIIIDEAWSMLTGHEITKYIEYMYRTCRKHLGATGIITQGVDEIEKSPIGSTIVTCTSTYFILDHSKNLATLPIMQKVLGFTDNDIKVLRTIENTERYKEVMIKLNNISKVYRTEVSDHARYLFTSNEDETFEIEKMNDKFGGNIEFTINNFVETKKLL